MVHLDSGLAETIDYFNELLHRAYYALEPSLTDGTIQFDVKLSDHEMLEIPDHLECLRWRVKKTPRNEIEHIITECSDAVSVINTLSKSSSQPNIDEIRKAREMFQRIGSALHWVLLVESGQAPVSRTGLGYIIPRSFPLHIRQAILNLQRAGGSDESIAQLIIEGQKEATRRQEEAARRQEEAARRQEHRESMLVHKEPLSERATMIYEKLRSLESHQAMTLPKIQEWYENETGKNLDEGTWKKIRKELLAYGLMNRPRAGYYIRCDDK